MAWVIANSMHDQLRDVQLIGRARSILVLAPGAHHLTNSSLHVVGLHGSHSDALVDSVSDVVALIKRKPRFSQLIILGDWNVDLLPSMSSLFIVRT